LTLSTNFPFFSPVFNDLCTVSEEQLENWHFHSVDLITLVDLYSVSPLLSLAALLLFFSIFFKKRKNGNSVSDGRPFIAKLVYFPLFFD